MRLFAIDTDNNITAFPAAEQIPEGQEHFASEKELAKLAANWPADRLVQVWNGFAGVAALRRHSSRSRSSRTARAPWPGSGRPSRRWTPPPRQNGAPTLRRRRPRVEARRHGQPRAAAPTAREGSKKAIVLELIRRKDGATLAEIAATDWQAHSIRGFISGSLTKKMGLKIESIKREDGERATCWRSSTPASTPTSRRRPPRSAVSSFWPADSA